MAAASRSACGISCRPARKIKALAPSPHKLRMIRAGFDQAGRQAGYLRAPLSRNTSGWGTVEIPIVCVKNGSGPTVLLTGGVHGDEYEGQIAVSDLARTLDPMAIQGRIIMLRAYHLSTTAT